MDIDEGKVQLESAQIFSEVLD